MVGVLAGMSHFDFRMLCFFFLAIMTIYVNLLASCRCHRVMSIFVALILLANCAIRGYSAQCEEDPSEIFFHSTKGGKIKTKTCRWLRRRKHHIIQICGQTGKLQRKKNSIIYPASVVCPKTCMVKPTDFSSHIFKNKNGKTVNCSWITKKKKSNRVKEYCPRPEVRFKCAKTCKSCGEKCRDDPTFQFKNNKKKRNCSWITKNNKTVSRKRSKYCSSIGKFCPHACGYCFPWPALTSIPSLEPSRLTRQPYPSTILISVRSKGGIIIGSRVRKVSADHFKDSVSWFYNYNQSPYE